MGFETSEDGAGYVLRAVYRVEGWPDEYYTNTLSWSTDLNDALLFNREAAEEELKWQKAHIDAELFIVGARRTTTLLKR